MLNFYKQKNVTGNIGKSVWCSAIIICIKLILFEMNEFSSKFRSNKNIQNYNRRNGWRPHPNARPQPQFIPFHLHHLVVRYLQRIIKVYILPIIWHAVFNLYRIYVATYIFMLLRIMCTIQCFVRNPYVCSGERERRRHGRVIEWNINALVFVMRIEPWSIFMFYVNKL